MAGFPLVLSAQSFSVTGKVEPSEIRIGDPARVHFELIQEAGVKVSVPQVQDTLCTGVELLDAPGYDTIRLDNGRIQVNIDYPVSAYDSGFYFIPALTFAAADRQVQSRPMGLTVHTVELTDDDQDLRPSKTVMRAPFSWKEFWSWTGGILAACLVLAGLVLLILKYGFRKKVVLLPAREEPVVPPYETAMQRLQEIQQAKIWQQGRIKEFYTDVTTVVREYLSGRFQVNAMESTTDETLELAGSIPEVKPLCPQLKEFLQLADLVKFAKHVPVEAENNRFLQSAFDMVEATKPVVPTLEQEDADGQERRES
ncbi:MAG: hypothetical protein J6Z12_03550 [Paludibacteraceae bacterium]|nr:hypothetical protein [Paludibacteraceae bacterium]